MCADGRGTLLGKFFECGYQGLSARLAHDLKGRESGACGAAGAKVCGAAETLPHQRHGHAGRVAGPPARVPEAASAPPCSAAHRTARRPAWLALQGRCWSLPACPQKSEQQSSCCRGGLSAQHCAYRPAVCGRQAVWGLAADWLAQTASGCKIVMQSMQCASTQSVLPFRAACYGVATPPPRVAWRPAGGALMRRSESRAWRAGERYPSAAPHRRQPRRAGAWAGPARLH